MKKAANNQALMTTWGRFVLGAFVFAWLNVAAQPCMMPMEMASEPEVTPAHAGHGMHQVANDESHGDDGGCGFCPPIGTGNHQSACATMQAADCGDMSDANVDTRQLKFKFKDAPGMFAISQAPPQAISFRPTSSSPPPSCVRLRFTDGPSLNLRHCVFLK